MKMAVMTVGARGRGCYGGVHDEQGGGWAGRTRRTPYAGLLMVAHEHAPTAHVPRRHQDVRLLKVQTHRCPLVR